MSIYMTYWDDSGRDDYREVAKCFLTANDAVGHGNATAGQTTLTGAIKSHTGAATDTVNPGWYVDVSQEGLTLGATYGRVHAALPALSEDAEREKRWKEQLHFSWRNFCDTIYQPWWEKVAGDSKPARATMKWAYMQIALGRRIVDNTTGVHLSIAQRQARLDKINLWIGTSNAEVWYGVMAADNSKALSLIHI